MKSFSLRLFVPSLAIVILFIAFSCKTTKHNALTYQPLEKSLLWEIKGPGIEKPSYLYGTIHLIDAKKYFLPAGTMSAFEASKKVFFEIDMKEMTDISKLMGMMNKLFMKDGKTLKDLVSADEYKMISDHFQKKGLPMFMFERMKPMFLSVFANMDMDPSGLKSGSMKSYEMEFMEMAEDTKKETGGLESIDFQISLFDEIPYDAQAKMLVDAIKSETSDGDSEFKKMTDLYLKQDIDGMLTMISSEEAMTGFEDKLVSGRNKNWIPLIIEAAKKSPSFFAVGAGHLGGPDGVIHLLKKQGYSVKPAKTK